MTDVRYTAFEVKQPELVDSFHLLRCTPSEGPEHRYLAPKAWVPIKNIPEVPPERPTPGSLVLETVPPKAGGATLVSGVVDAPRAKDAVELLAAMDGLKVERWEDAEPGTARALLTGEGSVMLVRVLPTEGGYLFLAGAVARARLDEVGGALRNAILTLGVAPAE